MHCLVTASYIKKASVSPLEVKHIMDPVMRGLKHRQFQSFLEDIEAEFTDVLYHTNVRWLSMGKGLKRVWDLKAEIVMFFSMKDISCDFWKEMEREEWVCDFAFAVDIMLKLNELNTKLQGKGVLAHELYLEVKAFQSKLCQAAEWAKLCSFSCWKHELLHKHYQTSPVPSWWL